jgi:menaquinone-dependent protoporphyrinogen oxidase
VSTHSPNVLVLYATTHGHTAKIADRAAAALRGCGIVTDLRDVSTDNTPTLGRYDGVVVLGSVHAGGHQKNLVRYATDHKLQLNDRPAAFISVSLTAAEDTDEAASTTGELIDEFVATTGFTPDVSEAVAGCLQYREYDFMTRLLMRVITRKHADAHDMSHDHEYTDWERVDAFTTEFGQRVHARADAPALALAPPA